jgi:hypothetical protein
VQPARKPLGEIRRRGRVLQPYGSNADNASGFQPRHRAACVAYPLLLVEIRRCHDRLPVASAWWSS